MKKFFLVALALIVVLAGGFLVIVALQPADYRVERSAIIAAHPAEVFAQVNDFHQWEAWSPWAGLDPEAEESIEGPEAGTGQVFNWDGNEEVGKGSMKIVDSQPNESIEIDLEFVEPWEDSCGVSFTFTPKDGGTEVIWAMHGKNNFVGKAMCLFMDIDKMVGEQDEQGLANLKKVSE